MSTIYNLYTLSILPQPLMLCTANNQMTLITAQYQLDNHNNHNGHHNKRQLPCGNDNDGSHARNNISNLPLCAHLNIKKTCTHIYFICVQTPPRLTVLQKLNPGNKLLSLALNIYNSLPRTRSVKHSESTSFLPNYSIMVPPSVDSSPGTPGLQVNTPCAYYPGIYTGIENLMNPIYGLNINFTNILRADASNLRDSPTMLVPYLKNRLLENICNNTFSAQGMLNITLLTDHFTLTVSFDNSKASKPLHTIKSLECNMQFVTKTYHSTTNLMLFIHINWSSIFIDMNTSFPKLTTIPQPVPTIANPAPATTTTTTTTTTNTLNQQFYLQQESKMLTNVNQSKTSSPQTIHPYIPMKFDTIANDRYMFNHTYYRFHTPDQLTLLHDANITPPHQMRYVIYSAYYLASSFLTHNDTDNLPATFMTKINNDSCIIWDVLYLAFSTIPKYVHILNQNNRNEYETLYNTAPYDNERLYHAFDLKINQIKQNQTFFEGNCIVWETMSDEQVNHKFKDCSILKNDQALCRNFVNFCQLFKHGKKAFACIHQITETTIDTTSTPQDTEYNVESNSEMILKWPNPWPLPPSSFKIPHIYDHFSLSVPPSSLVIPVTHMLNTVHINTTPHIPSTDTLPSMDQPLSTSQSDHIPISPHIKTIHIEDLHTTPIPSPPPDLDHDITTSIRAQIDTSANITCTNMIDILHDYKAYNISFPCPFKLTGTIHNKPIYNLPTWRKLHSCSGN
eukprot:jgi/Psemu1/20795/gm1.20795_g